MLTLDRSPERFEGKIVVVRGQISLTVVNRGQIRELQVTNETNAKPLNLYFVTTRELADQLSEAPPIDITLPARLTCRVGKKDANGVAAIRVTRVDFLGRGNRVVKTLPSDEGASDPLIALNRHPERKIGQTVVLNARLTDGVGMRGQEPEYSVWLLTEAKPCNLQFTSSRDIATQLNADRGRGSTSLVRLTARVEDRMFGDRRYVTLLKIEYLGQNGDVLKTIQ
jgi:hypothetical protein